MVGAGTVIIAILLIGVTVAPLHLVVVVVAAIHLHLLVVIVVTVVPHLLGGVGGEAVLLLHAEGVVVGTDDVVAHPGEDGAGHGGEWYYCW